LPEIVTIISVFNGITGVLLFSRLRLTERIFIGYLILSLFFEIVAFLTSVNFEVLETFGIKNNLPGLHLFTLLQYCFLMFFFKEIFKQIWERDFFLSLLIVGSLLILGNSLFLQSIYSLNSNSKSFVDLCIIGLSIYYFYWVMNSDQIVTIKQTTDLFVVAVFLNAAISILIHLFSNQMWHLNQELFTMIWDIRMTVNIITQIIIGYGLFVLFKKEYLKRQCKI